MRLSVTFQDQALKRLNKLSATRSKSEIIREALVLEELYVETLEQGGKFVIHMPDGTQREIVRA